MNEGEIQLQTNLQEQVGEVRADKDKMGALGDLPGHHLLCVFGQVTTPSLTSVPKSLTNPRRGVVRGNQKLLISNHLISRASVSPSVQWR